MFTIFHKQYDNFACSYIISKLENITFPFGRFQCEMV